MGLSFNQIPILTQSAVNQIFNLNNNDKFQKMGIHKKTITKILRLFEMRFFVPRWKTFLIKG